MKHRLGPIEPEIRRLRRYARRPTPDFEPADDPVQACPMRAIARLDARQASTWARGFSSYRATHPSARGASAAAEVAERFADRARVLEIVRSMQSAGRRAICIAAPEPFRCSHGDCPERPSPGLAVVGSQEAPLTMIELRRALEALREEHAEVLRLVAVEGLKYEAVAAVLEVPVKTVRPRLSRAGTSLRVFLEGAAVGKGQGKAGEIETKGAA